MKSLVPYNPSLLPPEFLLDEHHPQNDAYMKSLRRTENVILATARKMKPKHVDIIKRYHGGQSKAEITRELKCSCGLVDRAINSDNGQELLSLLGYHTLAIEGANDAQRRQMLWRIAVDNEEEKPTVSINAVTELNRMAGIERENTPTKAPTIIINNAILPKGVLDV